jgi:molybdopterin-guanine dinucleotide biosynthesis protein MobB
MADRPAPPVVSIVGRKNSGKTTLLVALAAELGRRGFRIASLKHGHHEFEMDEPGRDTWRHFHEGGVEMVMMVGTGRFALISRTPGDPDPRELIETHMRAGAFDLVLVEGYKRGPFARIEVHRAELHPLPLCFGDDPSPRDPIALVTDRTDLECGYPVIRPEPDGSHVSEIADLLEARIRGGL